MKFFESPTSLWSTSKICQNLLPITNWQIYCSAWSKSKNYIKVLKSKLKLNTKASNLVHHYNTSQNICHALYCAEFRLYCSNFTSGYNYKIVNTPLIIKFQNITSTFCTHSFPTLSNYNVFSMIVSLAIIYFALKNRNYFPTQVSPKITLCLPNILNISIKAIL